MINIIIIIIISKFSLSIILQYTYMCIRILNFTINTKLILLIMLEHNHNIIFHL